MSRKLAKRQLVEPTYWTCPHGIRHRPEPALTYGPEVAELCDKANYTPDPQQELGLDLIFAINSDGSPATFAFCVICARQNLKSGLLLQACIGWLFVLDEIDEIAWSSHRLETSLGAMENFKTIMTGSPVLSKYLKRTRDPAAPNGFFSENGFERCELNTDQKVRFQTRTRDGGRGLGKKRVILDEAAWLKKRMVDALLPTVLAQPFPQIAYASSAPRLDEDSKVIRDVMHRGRNHLSADLSYIEWQATREPCADPDCRHPKDALARDLDCALDREHVIRGGNPTLTTGRITMRTLRALRQELDPEGYMAECLGWEETEADAKPAKLSLTHWTKLKRPGAEQPKRVVAVVDVEPDSEGATIGLAGDGLDGRTLVLSNHRPGITWPVDGLEKVAEHAKVLEIALTPRARRAFGKQLKKAPWVKKAEIEIISLTEADGALGCGDLVNKLAKSEIEHVDQPELNTVVAVARTKAYTSGGEVWDRAATDLPMGPLVACSIAAQRWQQVSAEKAPPPPPKPVRAKRTRVSSADNLSTVGF